MPERSSHCGPMWCASTAGSQMCTSWSDQTTSRWWRVSMLASYRRSERLFLRLYPGEARRWLGSVFLLAAILAALLGGCARYYWMKAGSTAEQFDRDSRECVQEAKSTVPGPVSGLAVDVIDQKYRTCLAG